MRAIVEVRGYGLTSRSKQYSSLLVHPTALADRRRKVRVGVASGSMLAGRVAASFAGWRGLGMSGAPDELLGHRYRLEAQLGQGGMGTVFRAYDRLTGQRVALKVVALEDESAPFRKRDEASAATVTLSPELLDELDRRGDATTGRLLVRVHAIVEQLRPTQRLRLARSSQVAASPSRRSSAIAARMALAQEFRTLASLRHPHIISVLDYGFAKPERPFFTMELLENAQTLVTTCRELPHSERARLLVQLLTALSYLHRHGVVHCDLKPANVMVVRDSSGPHVKLLDFGLAHAHEAVQRGDVAGTISYMAPELFEGEQPSEAADMFAFGSIAYEVFAGQHPFDRGDDAELVLALLGKEPDWKALEEFPRLVELLERLLSKSSLMRPSAAEALDALAQAMEIEVPKETSAMRDSALQAARFVGREGPWVMLRSGLDSARAGAGAAWLLAGESGVGKSRLMDELRVYALVQKVQVARGQAVREGGGAYCVWRQVLRMLCLASDPEELQASILKSVLPDLEALLERQIPDAPPLGPQAAELRLVGALEGVLTRQAEPLLLLLEDLHWADAESLHVLNRIAAVCSNFRIMIVASYRDDERADLPAQLPQCQLLKLSRLSSASLELLCESMLGKDACTPELVMFLERETEGNVFFVIEVLRFLAEQAGQLSLVAAQPLPKTVTTGGIQAVVQRRLAALPPAARPLLNLAAVAGRVLDLKLLKTFEPQLEQWLYIAVDAMILEATEQVWRFAHDKIRETLLVEMGPAEQQRLHLALAQAMTRVFPDSPAHAASLAEHFEKGGDAAQACHYSIDAGVYALNQSATQQAATFLQQARSSSGWSSVAPASAARALNHLMQACQVLGQLQRSVEVYEDLCALAKVSTVADRTGVAVLCRYSLNRLWSLVAQDDAVDTEQLRILHELAQATRWAVELFFWLGEIKRSVLAALLGIEIAQRVADKGLQAYFVVTLSCIVGLVPLRAPSQWLLQKGEKLAAGLSDSRARLDFFRLAGTVRWNEASLTEGKAVLDSAIADARAIGDEHSLMFALSFRGLIAFRTDDMPAFHAVTSELHERSERAGRPQWQRMYPMYKGVLALRERDYEAAQLHFQEAESAVALSRDHHGRVMISGQLARCALGLGNIPEAIARAGATVEMAANELRTFETIGRALCAVAETYLEIWKLGDKELQRQVAQPLQRALALARTCALTYPVLRAETLLRHSQYAQLHGASRLAKELALVSLYSAQRLGMAFDERSARAFIAELEKYAPADLPQLPRGLLKIFQVFARRLG